MDSKNNIKLVYWNSPNFGDILSPYIVEELSGKKIIHKVGYFSLKNSLKEFCLNILHCNFSAAKSILFPYEINLLAIGSILNLSNKRSYIWGSGFMKESDKFSGGKICALRGRYSNEKLIRMGYKGCSIYGDPALILPLIYKPKQIPNNILGIIPHWSETDSFIQKYSEKFKIIDLRTTDIKKVVDEIASCRYILSTSLHGIIVAQAYGIPAIWIKKGFIHTDGIKFKDYFSSVDIPVYAGFTKFDDIIFNDERIINFFKEHQDISLPHINVGLVQKRLLKCAPFELKDKYSIYI